MEIRKYNLEDIALNFFYGSMPKEEDLCDNGYPVFSGYRVVGYSTKYNIENRSLVVVARGVGGTGNVEIAEEKTFLTNLSIAVSIDEKLADIDFLKYYLNVQGLRYLDSGAAQSQITINNLKHHKIFIPSLVNQKQIASILSAYDNLIENNNKRIKILEQMAENLYKEWFVRFRFPGHETTPFENGIPRGWSEKRLSDLIDVDPLLPVKKGIQVKSIPMEALSTDSMIVDENCFQLVDNPSGSHSQNGDTLVARITPCLENGKTGFVQCLDDGETATGSTEFIVLRSKELSPYYVYCFARSQYFRQTAILSMNGADGRQRVNVPKIKSMKIAKPSNEIIKRFDSIAKPIFEEIYLLTKQNKSYIKQRDLLLPRLMSGKIVV